MNKNVFPTGKHTCLHRHTQPGLIEWRLISNLEPPTDVTARTSTTTLCQEALRNTTSTRVRTKRLSGGPITHATHRAHRCQAHSIQLTRLPLIHITFHMFMLTGYRQGGFDLLRMSQVLYPFLITDTWLFFICTRDELLLMLREVLCCLLLLLSRFLLIAMVFHETILFLVDDGCDSLSYLSFFLIP